MADINEREAIEEIQQMRIQYTNYYDTGDLEGVLSLFTEDAIVDSGVLGRADGIDEVRAYFAAQMEMTGRTLHFISNPRIELTGADTAKGEWYLQDVVVGMSQPGNPPVILYGSYSDEYRKVDGKWKMSVFRVSIELPTEWATAGDSQGEKAQ